MIEWLLREHPDEDGLFAPWTWAEAIFTGAFMLIVLPLLIFGALAIGDILTAGLNVQ